MTGPSFVMAIECSKWAATLPLAVRVVQPSGITFTPVAF